MVDSETTLILNDLVTLALAAENDTFIPDTHHINALPGPLRSYIHYLETRANPAGDMAEISMLKENNAALWARVTGTAIPGASADLLRLTTVCVGSGPDYFFRLTSSAFLSSRSPTKRECRRWPSGVISRNSKFPTNTGTSHRHSSIFSAVSPSPHLPLLASGRLAKGH